MPYHPVRWRPERCIRAAVGVLAPGLPLVAFAHTGADAAAHHSVLAAWAAGAAHPLTGLDHLAAMLIVGLWSALTVRQVWLAPMGFGAALLAGALLATNGLTISGVEPMIAVSLLVLGLLLATRPSLPAALGVALVAGFALFHGLAHGQELAGPFGGWALAGMAMSTVAVHAVGIGLGTAARRHGRRAPQLAGVAVAIFGAALLGALVFSTGVLAALP